jgi:CheY-like chemotaxis protein
MNDVTVIKPIDILLVEDNPGDVRLVVESLKDSKIRNSMSIVEDGEAAMAFLRRKGQYAKAIRPDLILLDLNLPKKNGREVLAEFKADPDLKRIPVVVITSSSGDEDVLAAYNHSANCYITKPVDLKQFVKVVKSIEEFWLAIVKLPPQ